MLRHRRLAAIDGRIVGGAAQHVGAIAPHPHERQIFRPHVTRRNRHEAHVVRTGERQRSRRRRGSCGGGGLNESAARGAA
jgi:hypothetical protein